MEAIILAGGLGTRLRSVVADLPKAMAEVAGKPFLHHVITELKEQGVQRFIFSLGYKQELIVQFLEIEFPDLLFTVALEQEPLGTGGAIQLALTSASLENVVIVNGDTLFKVDLQQMMEYHQYVEADCTLALKPMQNFDRYGVVEIDEEHRIRKFREKQHYASGLINGGVYMLKAAALLGLKLGEKFSFEKDYLEQYCSSQRMFGFVQNEYFIDIGVPEDFSRANVELGIG